FVQQPTDATAAPAVASVGCCTNASEFASPAVMSNGSLSTASRTPASSTTDKVYPSPALSMDRSLNVATPFTTSTCNCPPSVPAGSPALFPIETMRSPAYSVTPRRSSALSAPQPADATAAPAVASVGCSTNASEFASPAVMSN